jgi:hypothetical protein
MAKGQKSVKVFIKGFDVSELGPIQKMQLRRIAPYHSKDYMRELIKNLMWGRSYMRASEMARQKYHV